MIFINNKFNKHQVLALSIITIINWEKERKKLLTKIKEAGCT